MASLLSSVNKNEVKKAYQLYTLEHGIERLTVKIPLTEVSRFEAEFNALTTRDIQAIDALVKKAGGLIVEAARGTQCT